MCAWSLESKCATGFESIFRFRRRDVQQRISKIREKVGSWVGDWVYRGFSKFVDGLSDSSETVICVLRCSIHS